MVDGLYAGTQSEVVLHLEKDGLGLGGTDDPCDGDGL